MHKSLKKAAFSLIAVAACGVSLSVSASAQESKSVGATETSRRACFMADKIDGYAPVRFPEGVDGVNLRSGRDVFQLKFATPCQSIRDALRISVEAKNASRYVCTPTDADVISYGRLTGAEHCPVSSVRKFEPNEVAALPAAEKP